MNSLTDLRDLVDIVIGADTHAHTNPWPSRHEIEIGHPISLSAARVQGRQEI